MFQHALIIMCSLSIVQSASSLDCFNAFECVNQTTSGLGLSVKMFGYKAAAGSTSSIVSDTQISCHGAFACYSAAFIKVSRLNCGGTHSCAATFINKTGTIITTTCSGLNACKGSTIVNEGMLDCDGDGSCSYTNITFKNTQIIRIKAYGFQSLMNANIETPDYNATIDIYLYGYQSGSGLNIICKPSDTCNIDRISSSGTFQCIGNCIISNINISDAYNIDDLSLHDIAVNYSKILTANNDDICNNHTNAALVDNWNEYAQKTNITNAGPICCRGHYSCQYPMHITRESKEKDSIICSGSDSCSICSGSDIDFCSIINNGPVFCEGSVSCAYRSINTTDVVVCSGEFSCESATINIDSANVFCTGASSCAYAIIDTVNDINIYLLGYESGDDMTINCNNNYCRIFCLGFRTCYNTNVYNNSYPTLSPTIEPTLDPTIIPTLNPSIIPSQSPTIEPTLNPTIIPSQTPTIEPTLNPTIIPSQSPTIEPTFIPTIIPTQPTLNPTHIPTHPPIIEATLNVTVIVYFNISSDLNCSPNDIGWIDTSYTITPPKQSCLNGTIDVILSLINIIDSVYGDNNITIHSNITETERNKVEYMEDNVICDNVTVSIYSCFGVGTNKEELLRLTKSPEFVNDINNKLVPGLNRTIIHIYGPPVIYDLDGQSNDDEHAFDDILWIIIIALTVAFVCILIILIVSYGMKKKQPLIHPIIIRNPMVLLFGIGEYDEDPQDADFEGYVNDLKLGIDIKNLLSLFRDKLRYQTFPKYDENPVIHWKQDDLIDFLTEKAKIFEANVATKHDLENDNCDNKFDGLVIVTSSHGMDNNIISSDYKLISKDSIHRIFSSYHPKSRIVPRVIIYDCCDGDEEAKGKRNKRPQKHKGASQQDIGKAFDVKDIFASVEEKDEPQALWERGADNPDHKLVTIHAANTGFQSKMNSEVGSYLIHKFVKKSLIGLEKDVKNPPFIHEIFDDIQNELESGERKQLPTFMYNNNTRYIKFMPRSGKVRIDGKGRHEKAGGVEERMVQLGERENMNEKESIDK